MKINKGDVLLLTVPEGRSLPSGTHKVEIVSTVDTVDYGQRVTVQMPYGMGTIAVRLTLPQGWMGSGGFLANDDWPVGVVVEEQCLEHVLEKSIRKVERGKR